MNDVARSYAVLKISVTASPQSVKQAYRKLAKIWHPDRYINNPILRAKAEAEIKKINQAYAVIKADWNKHSNSEFLRNSVSSSFPPQRSSAKVAKTQNTPEFYYQQGMSYLESQDYNAALNSFARAIKLNPNYLEAYQCRGFILSKLGYDLRAEAEFKKANQIKLRNRVAQSYARSSHPQTKVRPKINIPLEPWHTLTVLAQPIQYLAIGYDGVIAAANGREINLWQADNKKKIGTLEGHTGQVTCLAVSHSGRILISGSQDKTIRFWDLETQKIIRTFGGYFDGHLSKVVSLALSQDDRTLVSGGADNSLRIWNMNRGMETHHISTSHPATCLALSPDGQLFAAGSLASDLQISGTKIGKAIRQIDSQSGISSLAFSPDGNLLATGGVDGAIKLWDITTGQKIYTLAGQSDRISQVIFAYDGKTLISSSWDRTIKIWKLSTAEELTCVEAHTSKICSMEISVDRRTIASGSEDGTVKLWRCNL